MSPFPNWSVPSPAPVFGLLPPGVGCCLLLPQAASASVTEPPAAARKRLRDAVVSMARHRIRFAPILQRRRGPPVARRAGARACLADAHLGLVARSALD